MTVVNCHLTACCLDLRAQIGGSLFITMECAFPRLRILMIHSNRYLIWIGSDQFGPTISELINRNIGPDRLILWDSKKRGMPRVTPLQHQGQLRALTAGGRPDVMKLIKETYVSWRAEVVFITSNYRGNQEMMEGCKEAGIPAFVRHLVQEFSPLPQSLLTFV